MTNGIKWLMLLALPLMFTFVACDDDDDPQPEPSVADVASNDSRFSTLVGALDQAGLVDFVSTADGITVFAPTNDAFDALGIDLSTLTDQQLTDILTYHVIAAEIPSTDIGVGQTYAASALAGTSSAYGVSQLIDNSNGTITINNTADVIIADVEARNGVIHAIDNVLLPPDIVDHAIANESFTALVGALGAASGDLVNVLKGEGPFTVFAPVNSAFEAIADVTATLSADQLASVLTYHVVPGAIHASDLSNGQVVTTVNGDTFTVNINGSTVTLTDMTGAEATVVLTDVEGTNGVIHVLDKVILPQL